MITANSQLPGDSLSAAETYARHGYVVARCHGCTDGECHCGAGDCDKPGKHPNTQHGLKDGSKDLERVAKAFKQRPQSNIAIVTGKESGIIVLDVDPRHGGDQTLAALEAEHGELPLTPRAATGGGGTHYVFSHPGETLGNRINMLPGLDVRGDGGYIIAAPSIHAEGRQYAWQEGSAPWEIPAAEIPAWLLAIMRKPAAKEALRTAPASTTALAELIKWANNYAAKAQGANQGGRNAAAFNLAGHLFAGICEGERLTVDQVYPIMAAWNLKNSPPVEDRELRQAVESAEVNGKPRADHEIKPKRSARPGNGNGNGKHHVDDKPKARQQIDTGCQELPVITTQAWAAIETANDPPSLFRSAGEPARIEVGDEGEPIVKSLDFHRLRHHAARVADWIAHKKSGDEIVDYLTAPPVNVINDMLATPAPPLPILRGIAQAPIFASDGTLQTTPGYHPRSGVFYAPAKGFSVPDVSERPTAEELNKARALICDDLLGDFPFVEEPEQAHAIALAAIPFLRDLIDGPTPLHLIEKPSPGTGATLLVDMLTFPALGYPVAVMTEGRDEDEWRKRITSKLRTMPAFVSIDNLRRRLDSAAVSSAITSRSWEDRKLGATEMLKIPVRCAWIATGNNPALSTEIARRTVRIRLDAHQDRPWLRTGFRHENLRAWAEENRGQLVWAMLTMIRAWLVAGRPKGTARLGMFEQWSEVIGGVLSVAGIPGFLGNLSQFYEASDAEGETWRTFLGAWLEQFGAQEVSGKELWPLAVEADLSLGDKSEQSQRIRLGTLIGEKRDRVYDLSTGRVRITKVGTHNRATLWQLIRNQ